MERLKRIVTFFIDTYQKWLDDRAMRMAAAVAYYTLFSLAPLVFLLATIAASVLERFLGEIAVQDELDQVLGTLLPAEISDLIVDLVVGTAQNTPITSSLPLISLISIGIILWGASNIFAYLHEALNSIWGLKPLAHTGLWATIRRRLVAFLVVFIVGFLLVLYIVVISLLSAAIPILNDLASHFEFAARILELLPDARALQGVQFLSFFVIGTLLFGTLYKILPDVEITWKDVFIGAAFTAFLFGIGTFLLSIYFSFYSSTLYGAAGSLVILLLWFYYSAQIFMFGAEFTYMYATRYGSHIRPVEGAAVADPALFENQGEEPLETAQ